MIIPKLRKQRSSKNYHNLTIEDDYAWVDQPDIIDVLQKPEKLLPEVKKFLDENNKLTDEYFKDSKDIQKKLFSEIKSKIKLADESLKFKDKEYYYWSKTTETGNYGKKLRQKIGSEKIEIYFDGDKEKELSGSEYFGIGSVSISENDKLMAYSLDLKGSEYYDILIKDLVTNEIIDTKITNTSGGITWNLDNKSFFYTPLDEYHRSRKIYKHILGTSTKEDVLIFEEEDETFSVGISLTSDEKYYVISTSDSHTVEEYFFLANDKVIKPQLFQKREKGIRYSIDSWKEDWYIQTNKNAADYQILKCKHNNINKTEIFIPSEKETIIGGLDFLDNYILRAVSSNAIPKIFIRNINTNKEEELIISDEPVGSPGISLIQKDPHTSKIRISWDSLASPGKIFEYDILTKKKN